VAKYTSRPLPRTPPKQPQKLHISYPSESHESILDHRLPSPFLCDQDEIQQIWSRASQHSLDSERVPSLCFSIRRTDSLETVTECSDLSPRRSRTHLESLLPPAPDYRYSDSTGESVPCRLSSSSSVSETESPPLTKRSATPDLLQKLTHELEELEATIRVPISTSPSATSYSFNMSDVPSPGNKKRKPSHVFVSASGSRNISSPMPSPIYSSGGSPLLRSTTNDSLVEPTYTPFRPAPLPTPPSTMTSQMPVQEFSHIDWDDDETPSKLARVKKSIGDLRTATLRNKATHSDAAPSMPDKHLHRDCPAKDEKLEPVPQVVGVQRPLPFRSTTAPASTLAQEYRRRPSHPVLRPAVSAARIRASLPPLPTQTPPSPPQPVHQLKKKLSIRATTVTTAMYRRRARSDTPQHFSSARSSGSSGNTKARQPLPPPGSMQSARSMSTKSAHSSTCTLDSLQSKPADAVHAEEAPHCPSKTQRNAHKRFSSTLSMGGRSTPKPKPKRSRVRMAFGAGKLRRWFRWVGQCSIRTGTVHSA
jgi:hypothetical protein